MASSLTALLRSYIANLYTLYYRAHSAHWNIEGAAFVSLHSFFGALADDTYGSIDTFAEVIRQQNELMPGSFTDLLKEGGEVSTVATTGDPKMLLTECQIRNNMVLSKIHAALSVAEKTDAGIANLLQDRLAAHHKWAWQLRSLLKGF